MKQAVLSILFVGAASFVPLATRTLSPARGSASATVRLNAQHIERPPMDLGLSKFFGLVATASSSSVGNAPAVQATTRLDDTCKSNEFLCCALNST